MNNITCKISFNGYDNYVVFPFDVHTGKYLVIRDPKRDQECKAVIISKQTLNSHINTRKATILEMYDNGKRGNMTKIYQLFEQPNNYQELMGLNVAVHITGFDSDNQQKLKCKILKNRYW